MKNMRVLVYLNFFNTKMIEIIHQNMQQQQYFMVCFGFFYGGSWFGLPHSVCVHAHVSLQLCMDCASFSSSFYDSDGKR